MTENIEFQNIIKNRKEVNIKTNWNNISDIEVVDITFFETERMLHECRMSLKVDFKNYQEIETKKYFNLIDEVKGKNFNGKFSENKPVFIDIKCKPELIISIMQNIADVNEMSEFLKNPAKENLKNLFFEENNWYALNVKQAVELPEGMEGELKSGYKTHWSEIGTYYTKSNLKIDILNTVIDYLNYNSINFAKLENGNTLTFRYQTNEHQWNCYFVVKEDFNSLFFYSVFPISMIKQKIGDAVKLITKINFSYNTGRFEISEETGELRYTTCVNIGNGDLEENILNQIIADNLVTFDNFFDIFMQLIKDVPFEKIYNSFSKK